MPAWLAPLALGLLSAGGAVAQNRANAREAERNRQFQERMSSTSAQRSVKDYTDAGLNPALAYERGASTPGGAQAVLGEPVSAGISTAQQARALTQQMQIAREQNDADLRLKRVQADAEAKRGATAEAQGLLTTWEARRLQRDFNFEQMLQPFQLRAVGADTLLKELSIPGARNQARLDERMGIARPIIGDILSGIRAAAPLLLRR